MNQSNVFHCSFTCTKTTILSKRHRGFRKNPWAKLSEFPVKLTSSQKNAQALKSPVAAYESRCQDIGPKNTRTSSKTNKRKKQLKPKTWQDSLAEDEQDEEHLLFFRSSITGRGPV